MTKLKEIPEHKDILGQELKEGDYVAVSDSNRLYICCIKKITPKQLRVLPVQYSRKDNGLLKYPSETILLSDPDALVYILKYSGTR